MAFIVELIGGELTFLLLPLVLLVLFLYWQRKKIKNKFVIILVFLNIFYVGLKWYRLFVPTFGYANRIDYLIPIYKAGIERWQYQTILAVISMVIIICSISLFLKHHIQIKYIQYILLATLLFTSFMYISYASFTWSF